MTEEKESTTQVITEDKSTTPEPELLTTPIIGIQNQLDTSGLPDPSDNFTFRMNKEGKPVPIIFSSKESKDIYLDREKKKKSKNGDGTSVFAGGNRRKGIRARIASFMSNLPAKDKTAILYADDINEDILMEEMYRHGVVHDELIYLSQIIIPNTRPNCEWAYKHSPTAQVIQRIISMTITGSGVVPRSDDLPIQNALKELFSGTLRGPDNPYSVEDLIDDIVRDNIVHGLHVSAIITTEYKKLIESYGIEFTGKRDEETDPKPAKNKVGRPRKEDEVAKEEAKQVHKLDGRTIQKVTHPTTGQIKFIQDIFAPMDIPTSDEFYSDKYNPVIRTHMGQTVMRQNQKHYIINIEPSNTLHVNLFREPPMAVVLNHVAHSLWLEWAMKKVGMKYAAPIPIIQMVADGEIEEQDEVTRKSSMDKIADNAAATRFSDSWVLDHNQKLVENKLGGNVGFNFVEVIAAIDRKIALALGASSGLFESSGAELATSRTIQDMFLRGIETHRRKIELQLRILCYKHLSARNIPFEENSFEFTWSPLRDRMMGEVINALVALWNSGVIKTQEEARDLAKGVFDMEQLDDEGENLDYMEVIKQKSKADAEGRVEAELEAQVKKQELELDMLQKTLNMQLEHDTKRKSAGLDAPASQSGSSTPSKKPAPGTDRSASSPKENKQGSTTGVLQAGDRPRGPQKTAGASTGAGKEESNTGKN